MAGKKDARRCVVDRRWLEALEDRRLLATLTWVGDIDSNWGSVQAMTTPPFGLNTNWSGNLLPQTGDTLVFPAGARAITTNDLTNLNLAAIQITGVGVGSARYSIGGNALTLSGATAVSSSAAIDALGLGPRLTLPVRLGANTAINVSAAGALEITGAITGNNFNKTGAGTLIISNTGNDFAGSSVSAGTLKLGASNVYPDDQAVTVNAGATFDLNNFNERIGALRPGGGAVKLGTATLTIGFAGILGSFDGVITGAGGVTVDGSAQLGFTGSVANTYAGTTLVKDGSVFLDKVSGVNGVPGDLVIGGAGDAASAALNGEAGNDEQVADTSNVTLNAQGEFFLGSRTETIGSLAGQVGGAMHLGLGTLKIAGDRNTTFDGIIDDGSPGKAGTNGGNSLIKSGLGTLTLTAANPLTATTRIQSGTLFVNGTQTASPVVVVGGTLGGSGSVGSVTVAAGTVAPGAAAGMTAILRTKGIALNTQTRLSLELNGLDPGSENDQLNVQGGLSLGGARLELKLASGFVPVVGLSFVLINNDGSDAVNGTFNGLPEGSYFTLNGQTFRITYAGGTGNDVVLMRTEGPAVLSASFDPATAPRLVFTFTENVQSSLGVSDLLVRNLDTNSALDPATFTLSYNPSTQTATFTHGGPLPDGNYRASLNGAGVSNSSGVVIGAVTTLDFFTFAGDANRDRTVDFNDLVALAQNYNTTGRTFDKGDFNYDGKVDFNDLVLLAQRYNTSLPPPPIVGVLPAPVTSPLPSAANLRSAADTQPTSKRIFSLARVRKPVARPPRRGA